MKYVLNRRQHALIPSGGVEVIQTGEITFTGNSGTDTLSAVILDKSLLIYQYMADVALDDPDLTNVDGEITNTTTVTFERDDNVGELITVRYWVLEYAAASGVIVQRGSVSVGSTPVNVGIAAVDLANSFPIVSSQSDSIALTDHTWPSADITSTTNLQLTSGGAATHVTKWQVIDHPNYTVTKYTATLLNAVTLLDTAITAVDLANTWLVVSGRKDDTGVIGGDDVPRSGLQSTTNIRAERDGGTDEFDFIYYVVENDGSFFNVQQLNDFQITGGNSDANTSITSVDTDRSIIYSGSVGVARVTNVTDTTARGDVIILVARFLSATSVEIERELAPGVVVSGDYQVIEFM